MNQYHKPYTAEDSAIVFIDFQPQMLFGVASADRATMINNVTLLAKVAKEFKVPTVLTSVETESFSGYVWPQLLDIFPGQPVIERSSMNSWDSMDFRKAIEATGRKNIIMTGLWTEVCITWPTIGSFPTTAPSGDPWRKSGGEERSWAWRPPARSSC